MHAPARALALSAVLTVAPQGALCRSASAQAFTPPEGTGSVTVGWQFVDNTGHRFSDGFYLARGQSVTTSLLVETEYAFTDRLTASVGVPFVFAKYTGAQPPQSRLPVDACACWHSSFQDLGVAARYRFGGGNWALTPLARFDMPTHDYAYAGEAVVGRRLRELNVGVSAGLQLAPLLPKASVQATYAYSFVEKPIKEVGINRSSGAFDVGYALSRRWYLRGTAAWQHTHGGLRIGSPTGNPFFPPGEFDTPEKFAQRDRLLHSHYWQAGGGVSYNAGPMDLYASVMKYVWGRDAHNGQVYNVGVTWYFDVSKGGILIASRDRQPVRDASGRKGLPAS